MTTGFLYDESYFWHDTGTGALHLPSGGYVEADTFAESPETKRRVKNLLERSKFIKQLKVLEPRPATVEEVARVHDRSYIEKVCLLSDAAGGHVGEEAIVGRGSYEIALLAAGGAITAVDAVMQGDVQNAYALTRPPGHHATREAGMGFCLFNNVAVAARHAQERYGLQRIAILDWDVHHGNGTEDAFYDEDGVLFISLHEHENYPLGRGLPEHAGTGAGRGHTINIPLPAGTAEGGYMAALEQIVAPVLDQYRPELILISAGQDASFFDPLGHMMITADGYYQMTVFLKDLAAQYAAGRLVACHEGGYSTAYVPFCTLRIIEALAGLSSGVPDPFAEGISPAVLAAVLPHQQAVLDEVKEAHRDFWRFPER